MAAPMDLASEIAAHRPQCSPRCTLSSNLIRCKMQQVGDRDPEFVFHLILDSTKCQKVEGLDQFNALEVLSMNSCGLTSLQGFPKLPQLKEVTSPQLPPFGVVTS